MALRDDLAERLRRPGGDARLRCLALLHGAACAGRADAVAVLAELAGELGIPSETLRETALQVVAYAGFPRALDALAVLAVLAGAVPAGTGEAAEAPGEPEPRARTARGRQVFDAVYGEDAEPVLAGLARLAPELPAWVVQDAYGRVLARPGLSLREREILAVAGLALLALPVPLASHARGALRNGSNAAEVIDILDACRGLAGPQALAVIEQTSRRLSRKPNSP